MPIPAARPLLRRHAAAFAVAFTTLTAVLLANFAVRELPRLSAKGASAGTLAEFMLLAVPLTAAMTIPMAILVAVLWVFTQLGSEGTLASARRERDGIRRVVAPVLAMAAGLTALTLVLNTQILPRSNERLASLMTGAASIGDPATRKKSDREMTIPELRSGARAAAASAGPLADMRAAGYEIEIQKKYALAATCVILALFGAALPLRFPHGGAGLVIAASLAVFTAYYAFLIVGESLGRRLVVSPFVAMWMANVLFFVGAGLLMWRSRERPPAFGVPG